MRKFTERYKLTALSLKEIREGVKAATKRLADQDVKCDGHIVAQANVINCFVLWCLKHSPEKQDEIVKEMAPELERHKASEYPLPIAPLVVRRIGRKRAAHPIKQSIIDSATLGDDDVTADNGAPHRRR